MLYFLLLIAVAAGGYFAFRYFSLCKALRNADLELQEIQKDPTQNHILHLPLPNRSLEGLLGTINSTLAELKDERLTYQKREEEFQQQIAHVSHDLRTPLTVILGYLKYIKKTELKGKQAGTFSETLPEALETIERKAKAMSRLVAQFYDFSLLSVQNCEYSDQEMDACRILRETLLDSYQLLEEKSLSVEAALPDCPIPAKGNPEALERIFSNLFQNAGRYASSFLKIRLSKQPENICITFTNDAEQLSPQDIPCLFKRFYMQNAARTQSGTGLGLTIAKSLAESMGGSLTAELIALEEGANTAMDSPTTGQAKPQSISPTTALQFTLTLKPM